MGAIHADAKFKVATLIVYLNEDWADIEGGKLRVLRSGTDIEDYAAEAPPQGGLAVYFRVQRNSWLGHKQAHHRAAPLRDAELLYRCRIARPRSGPPPLVEPGEKFRRLFGVGHIAQKAA